MWLVSGNDGWIDIQMMADEARVHSRSLVSIPRKYINVVLKKNYQLFLLLRWKLSPNLKKLLWIVTNGEFLQILTFGLFGRPPRW